MAFALHRAAAPRLSPVVAASPMACSPASPQPPSSAPTFLPMGSRRRHGRSHHGTRVLHSDRRQQRWIRLLLAARDRHAAAAFTRRPCRPPFLLASAPAMAASFPSRHMECDDGRGVSTRGLPRLLPNPIAAFLLPRLPVRRFPHRRTFSPPPPAVSKLCVFSSMTAALRSSWTGITAECPLQQVSNTAMAPRLWVIPSLGSSADMWLGFSTVRSPMTQPPHLLWFLSYFPRCRFSHSSYRSPPLSCFSSPSSYCLNKDATDHSYAISISRIHMLQIV